MAICKAHLRHRRSLNATGLVTRYTRSLAGVSHRIDAEGTALCQEKRTLGFLPERQNSRVLQEMWQDSTRQPQKVFVISAANW